MRVAPVLAVFALLVGCSSDEDERDDSDLPATCQTDEPECDPYDEVHFLGTWATDVCRVLLDCCEGADRPAALDTLVGEGAAQLFALEPTLLSDEDACIRAMALALGSTVQQGVIALTDDRQTFDRDAAEECIGYATLAADLCAPVLLLADAAYAPSGCEQMFRPAVARGGVCTHSDDCVPGDDGEKSTCMRRGGKTDGGTLVSASGVCEAMPGRGERCAEDGGECPRGLYCAADELTCEPRAGKGERCVGRPCTEAAYCDEQSFICRTRGVEDAACAHDEQCAMSLVCDDELRQCVDPRGPSPLEAEFDFCLGDGDNRRMRDLLPPALLEPLLSDVAARFLVQAFAATVSLADEDEGCGFASPGLLAGADIPAPGDEGSVVYDVSGCAIERAEPEQVLSDCRGTGALLEGRVVVTGTKTLRGIATGDSDAPVIPTDDTPATFELTLELEGLVLEAGGIQARFDAGTLTGHFTPRTARSSSTDACTVPTGIARIEGLEASDVELTLLSGLGEHTRTVNQALLRAVAGTWDDESNVLAGTLMLNGKPRAAPVDENGLDPYYDEALFAASWECEDDLATPVSHECPFLASTAHALGALSAQLTGVVAELIDEDTSCGFASPAVAGAAESSGDVGDDNGALTFEIDSPCTITLPELTVTDTDCHGVEVTARGAVQVTGQKTVRGFLTGNPASPIVPTRRAPVSFILTMAFDTFEVRRSDADVGLRVLEGELEGRVRPRLALDEDTGACTLSTPVAGFESLTWSDGRVQLLTDEAEVELRIPTSSVQAQTGSTENGTNTLGGSLTVGAQSFSLPTPEVSDGLDPDFDADHFEASYACREGLKIPASDEDCSFRTVLADAARVALVQQSATAAQLLDGDDDCGFSSGNVLANGEVEGQPGATGSITWSIDDCSVGPLPPGTLLASDCLGNQTRAGGAVAGTGTKRVEGLRQDGPVPVVPLEPDASSLSFSALSFDGLSVEVRPSGASLAPLRSVLTGGGRVLLSPIAGQSEDNPGVFSVPTPVLGIDELALDAAELVLTIEGSTFRVQLSDVALSGLLGAYDGVSNRIEGELTIDGQRVEIEPSAPLLPDYDQAAFDATYACTPDLAGTVPP